MLLFLGAFTAIAVVAASFTGDQRIRRSLRKSAAKRIQDLADDERAKVVGRARAVGDLVDAPISGRPCIAFAENVVVHGGNTSKTFRVTGGAPFMLEDDSGRALVDPAKARISLETANSVQAGTLDDPIPSAAALLERHGQRLGSFREVFYREAVIVDGDRLAVLGAGTREPDPDAPPAESYRGDPKTRLRLTSSKKHPLVITDDPSALK